MLLFCLKCYNGFAFGRSQNPHNGLKALHSSPPPTSLFLSSYCWLISPLVPLLQTHWPSCWFLNTLVPFIRPLHLLFPFPGFSSPRFTQSSPSPPSDPYSNIKGVPGHPI